MKKTTRILSLLITLSMLITMAVPVTVSASFSDVDSNHHYYDAINNLSAEGILNGFEDGSFKPGEVVTRAQFTKVICYALSVGNLTYSEAERNIFTDVAPEHWAANNIVTAYRQGIINGMGDGTFAPDAPVNYEQAVKMVVCALGYSPQRAEALGGYPGGYLSIASSAKLLSGIIDATMGKGMNRGAVAKLIDNMRDAEQIFDGEGGGSLREEMGESKKVNAQLIAGYGVSLYSDPNPCYKNQIELDLGGSHEDNLFNIDELTNFDINKYLGRSVTVHYETEVGSTDRIVTNITLQAKKNTEIKINLDMISDYDSTSIEYYTDSTRLETETVYYSSTAKKLFNGEYTDTPIATLLGSNNNLKKSGHITLLTSDSGDTANVVFLKVYDMMVVSHIDRTNKKVYAKNAPYTGGIVLDVKDSSKNVKITKGGKDFAVTSLGANNIVSIAKSTSGNVIEAIVSDKGGANGTIVALDSSNTQITLNSSNNVYTLLYGYEKGGSTEEVVVGKQVEISFDAFGKVARVVFKSEKAMDYAYLATMKTFEMDGRISAVLYKPAARNSNNIEGTPYDFADRVKINGHTYTVTDDMVTIENLIKAGALVEGVNPTIGGTAPTHTTYAQPIRYSLDGEGKIKAISTNQTAITENAVRLALANQMTDGTGIECTSDNIGFGKYTISSSTPIIYVPSDRTMGDYGTKSNTFFDKDTSYYVQFANADQQSGYSAGCVYLYGVVGGSVDTATITKETTPMIVKKITDVVVDTSDKKFILVDIATGSELTCYDNDIAGTAGLTVGDVVRVSVAERTLDNGQTYTFIEALESPLLADAESVVAGTYSPCEKHQGNGSGIDYDFRTLISTVKEKFDNKIIVVSGYTTSGTEETYNLSSSVKVYKVDLSADADEKVTVASTSDIGKVGVEGLSSRIMIYTVDAAIKSIVIFE